VLPYNILADPAHSVASEKCATLKNIVIVQLFFDVTRCSKCNPATYRIFEIGPIVFEFIRYKHTKIQIFPLFNISMD